METCVAHVNSANPIEKGEPPPLIWLCFRAAFPPREPPKVRLHVGAGRAHGGDDAVERDAMAAVVARLVAWQFRHPSDIEKERRFGPSRVYPGYLVEGSKKHALSA